MKRHGEKKEETGEEPEPLHAYVVNGIVQQIFARDPKLPESDRYHVEEIPEDLAESVAIGWRFADGKFSKGKAKKLEKRALVSDGVVVQVIEATSDDRVPTGLESVKIPKDLEVVDRWSYTKTEGFRPPKPEHGKHVWNADLAEWKELGDHDAKMKKLADLLAKEKPTTAERIDRIELILEQYLGIEFGPIAEDK